jgi:hypothetical protein
MNFSKSIKMDDTGKANFSKSIKMDETGKACSMHRGD